MVKKVEMLEKVSKYQKQVMPVLVWSDSHQSARVLCWQNLQEHSRKSPPTSSQHWLVFLVSFNIKVQRFNYWIYPVLSKVPRMVKVVVSKLLLSVEHAIWSLSCSIQPDQCNIKELSNINWKALVLDWTKAHQISISKRKIRAVLQSHVWSTQIESTTKLLRLFWNSTRSIMLIFVLNVMLLKMISSILLKEIESIFLACMHWIKLTPWHWMSSIFWIKSNIMSQLLVILDGISMN